MAPKRRVERDQTIRELKNKLHTAWLELEQSKLQVLALRDQIARLDKVKMPDRIALTEVEKKAVAMVMAMGDWALASGRKAEGQ